MHFKTHMPPSVRFLITALLLLAQPVIGAAVALEKTEVSNTPATQFFGPEAPPRVVLSSEHAVTAERIAALPEEERAAWEQYLARSVERRRAEQEMLAAEVLAAGLAAPRLAPSGDDFRLPSKVTAAWFAAAAGRATTEAVLSFQTPSGGWSKHVRYDRGPRSPGMHWSSQTDPWHYVGTFDNRSTTEQLRLLASVWQAAARDDLSAAFLRGLDYILDAQFPNGGWPQGYPLEGKYHDEITLNDDALTHILELLRDVAAGLPGFVFVDDARRTRASEAFAASLRCVVKMQVVQNGQPTVWCAQHDPLTLAPAAARLKEPASLSGAESAGLLKFLMRLPEPSPEIVRAIESGLVWFERSRLTGLRPTQRDGRSFYATDPTATDAYWARFYDLATNRPIFAGAQDGIIYDSFEEMWTHNRFGYDYFTRKPEDLLTKERARWQKLREPGAKPKKPAKPASL